jgi:ABC-type microcin C transport system permease subunit YejB
MVAPTAEQIWRELVLMICIGICRAWMAVVWTVVWLLTIVGYLLAGVAMLGLVSVRRCWPLVVAVALVVALAIALVDIAIPHQNEVNSRMAAAARGAK